MRKIWDYISRGLQNPIILILVFTLIGGILLISFKNNENSIEYFLSCIGLGISIAVMQCAQIQNQIQKDNIKIQLFDKRYNVFQSVLETITIIRRDNWDRYILFNENDINKQMILLEENMYTAVHLSACLFDSNVHSKLIEVNNAFCKVASAYKNMITCSLAAISNKQEEKEYQSVLVSHILKPNSLGSEEYENELKNKFPHLQINFIEFSKECNEYLKFIDDCGIMKLLQEYIVVDKLEK